MHVNHAIAALRADRGPQRLAQVAMRSAFEAWQAEPETASLLGDLDRFGAGAALEDCPALEAALTGPAAGSRFAATLVRRMCAVLAENPWGHPPFRNGFDGRATSMLLARSGRAELTLHSREPGRFDARGRLFADAVRHDAVLAGSADARLVRIVGHDEAGRAQFCEERLDLAPGARLSLDEASETLVIDAVATRLVLLRLSRARPGAGPMREYAPEDGTLLQQCAPDIATSRREALVALLGRMGRVDAAPHIAAVALADGDASLRWQALRECLGLDTAAGFAALCAIARRPGDALAAPAGALRAQLIEAHPQLQRLEDETCPA